MNTGDDGFHSRFRRQLLQYRPNVILHGVLADLEVGGDLPIRAAGRQRLEHLPLPGGQFRSGESGAAGSPGLGEVGWRQIAEPRVQPNTTLDYRRSHGLVMHPEPNPLGQCPGCVVAYGCIPADDLQAKRGESPAAGQAEGPGGDSLAPQPRGDHVPDLGSPVIVEPQIDRAPPAVVTSRDGPHRPGPPVGRVSAAGHELPGIGFTVRVRDRRPANRFGILAALRDQRDVGLSRRPQHDDPVTENDRGRRLGSGHDPSLAAHRPLSPQRARPETVR